MRTPVRLAVLVVLALAAGTAPASAADCVSGTTSWTNPSGGSWDDAANWSNGVPSASCDARITLDGTYTVEVGSADQLLGHGVTARSIVLGGATGTQTLHNANIAPCHGCYDNNAITSGAGGITLVGHGVLDLDRGHAVVNTGGLRLDGGVLTRGDVVGDVLNASGTVRVDADKAALRISGNYSQGPDGTLDFALGPSAADMNTIIDSGTVRLDGTLVLHQNADGQVRATPAPLILSDQRVGTFAHVSADNPYEVDYDDTAVLLELTGRCSSGSTEWTNDAGGSWFDRANWSNGLPSAACDVVIAKPGTYTVDIGPLGGAARSVTVGGASGTQTLREFGDVCPWEEVPCTSRLIVGAGGVSVGTHGALVIENGDIAVHGAARINGGTLSGRGGDLMADDGVINEGGTLILDGHGTFRIGGNLRTGGYTQNRSATLLVMNIPLAGERTPESLLEVGNDVHLDGTLRLIGHAPVPRGPIILMGSVWQTGTFSNVVFDDQRYEVDYDRGAVSLWAPGSTCQSGSTSWTNPKGGDLDDPANWSNGRPSAACDAFITLPGTYEVATGLALDCGADARSLTIGGKSGTQTLFNSTYGSGLNCPGLSGLVHIGSGGLVIGSHALVKMFGGHIDVDGSVELAGAWSGKGSFRAAGGFHNTSGTITLGSDSDGGDGLSIEGDYTQGAAATLKFTDIPSDARYADGFGAGLGVSGAVRLDGTLDLAGRPPQARKPQRIVQAGGPMTGRFATVTSHRLPYAARYAPDGVDVVPFPGAAPILSRISARPRSFATTTQLVYGASRAATVTMTVSDAVAKLRIKRQTAKRGFNHFMLDARCRGRGLCLLPGRYRVTLVATNAAGFRSAARSITVNVKRS